MDREAEFLSIYERLATKFPRLKITMEHITTKAAVELLDRYENLCATVTLHHLIITLDDLAGGMLKPHLFCKPIAKRPEDRDALLQAALRAHPKLMLGSDSAPAPTLRERMLRLRSGRLHRSGAAATGGGVVRTTRRIGQTPGVRFR